MCSLFLIKSKPDNDFILTIVHKLLNPYTHFTFLCSDEVGYDQSQALRFVVVDDTSVSFKTILQTLFRLLGRFYEHQRADRDMHVNIYEQNIERGKKL